MSAATGTSSSTSKLRQYGLLGLLALMVVYFGGEWIWAHAIQGPVDEAERMRDKLDKGIAQREKALTQAKLDARRLDVWKSQSLPADTEVARSLYQAWLMELVGDVEFVNPSVSSSEAASRKGMYNAFAFSLRARGTLDQLKKFLFVFYQTDLLHQIRSLNITPVSKAGQLDLSITIEALALVAGAEELPETVFEQFRERTWRISTRLASTSLDAYDPIVHRNLFGMGDGVADPSDFAKLTSITMTNREPEIWFTLWATDEVVRLREGDLLKVGSLSFTIFSVQETDVILEADGERWLLTLGDKLTDAYALPPEY